MLAAAVLVGGCTQSDATGGQQELVKTVNVETRKLEPQSFASYLKLIGTVEATGDARISAEESGRIMAYHAEEGALVRKGELIARIDDRQLEQEEARLKAVTEQARQTYQRQKQLWEQDSIGSEIDYLNARYNYQQQKASLEAVRVRLKKTGIRAPFDAVFEDKLVEEGEMVSAGVPVVRLIANTRVKVVAGVPARYADVVRTGDTLQVWFDTVNSDTLRSTVAFVGSSIDPQARTFRIETLIPNTRRRFKVDMVANVRIQTLHRPRALVVGEEYVYQKNGSYAVYTVGRDENDENIALEKPVSLGPSYGNEVVLEKGVNEGDELITVGSSFLKDSMRIKVVNASSPSFTEQKGVQ